MTQGQRNATYARGQHARTNGHLVPFFGSMVLPEITAGTINEYRIHRLEESKALRGKPPAHNTMHQEIVTLPVMRRVDAIANLNSRRSDGEHNPSR
jgi:hypothetical protein